MKSTQKLPSKKSFQKKSIITLDDETPFSLVCSRWQQILLFFSVAVIFISQSTLSTFRTISVEHLIPRIRTTLPSAERCMRRMGDWRPVAALSGARVPAYPGAVLSKLSPTFDRVEYVTDTPVDSLSTFYSRLLAGGCWKPVATSDSQLRFVQGDRTLTISFTHALDERSIIAYSVHSPRIAGAATKRASD